MLKPKILILGFVFSLSYTKTTYTAQGILNHITPTTLSIQTNFENNLLIAVLPQTQINTYNCGIFGTKKQINTKNLEKGSFVKIKGSKNGSIIIAEKIVVECDDQRRAY
ncbi:hypothetical protein KJQ75_03975 [Campylobacter lari]|uniref:hypothetical protein n=1 Tax=Campylobacter lari TaxID=201 RepID=UPI00128A9548|nr:hypothetical protein [Campylobacter lari]MBT0816093.1 hypothetical protein [Campylobacter lari]MBT0827999.1 hypothetical protein [Campylobacter lari]